MSEQTVQMEERLGIDVSDHVATVTLTRPEKHNALDVAMFDAITAAAAKVAVEPGVRAVVLHGEGPSFCSGLDVAGVMANQPGSDALMDPLRGPVPNWFQRAAHGWLEVPVPVIVAIHGYCLGGGLQIALAGDIRFATPDARMSVLEVKWGLIPDMAITRTLPRLVGIDVAKELAYTGRVISGSDAHGLGLVTHLAEDPLTAAQELAAEIAQSGPLAVMSTRETLRRGLAEAVETATERELVEQEWQRRTADFKEGVKAMAERRTPNFEGR
jgi:enoyl-CoA hydratase/carnithine racemase